MAAVNFVVDGVGIVVLVSYCCLDHKLADYVASAAEAFMAWGRR